MYLYGSHDDCAGNMIMCVLVCSAGWQICRKTAIRIDDSRSFLSVVVVVVPKENERRDD